MDGISLLMALLTSFITVIAMLVSWKAINERVALHYLLILVMESGIMGVFLSLDLFLFYLFWEVMLVPMFLLIGIWGHGRRIYSAVKFFIYTIVGLAPHAPGDHRRLPDPWRADRQLHLFAAGPDTYADGARGWRAGSSPRFCWPLPSRCRSSLSTPGSPTPIPTPPLPEACFLPASC